MLDAIASGHIIPNIGGGWKMEKLIEDESTTDSSNQDEVGLFTAAQSFSIHDTMNIRVPKQLILRLCQYPTPLFKDSQYARDRDAVY